MKTSGITGQAVTGCHKLDLLEAQDILSEIAENQRYFTILNVLSQESLIQIDPNVDLLLDCYEAAAVPAKLQAVIDLIESVRKTLP
ncbi:hypothetical protein IQ219_18150 [Synechocystis sp. LEGE 06083]|uniref:hypothetical protein n=1 Tax=Synechocystis sp. LEGE 06083 TaxID=915336 RepID=UPI00187F0880|nr:hypothetical protein [Synechocystis sp. LEGE 06083]MBE9197180.1 hypothetical protein [Synechocystis sp. LEGE 06083]